MRRWVKSWRKQKPSYSNWRTVEIRCLFSCGLLNNSFVSQMWIRCRANHRLIFWNCYWPTTLWPRY